MKELTSTNVTNTFMSCLFKEGESHENYVDAPGIIHHVGFHPERLKEAKEDVIDYLSQLPKEFFSKEKGGEGGWSFLNACYTRNGVHWGEHIHMEQLFQLGCALGLCECLLPREMWKILPGGVPYYVIKVDMCKNKEE